MDDHARKRLALFGRVCTSVGRATQILGETLTQGDLGTAAAANRRIGRHLLDAAEVCDELAQYSVRTAGHGTGYTAEDATAMALLFRMLDYLGRVVAEVSRLRLFDPAGPKFETWIEVAGHLRDAATAAEHRGEFHSGRGAGNERSGGT